MQSSHQHLMCRVFTLAALLAGVPTVFAAPAPPAIEPGFEKRIEWFRDQKFGLFLHWGIYSQLGCIESWPVVWEDRRWGNPGIRTYPEMQAFRTYYFLQNRTFNPDSFKPDEWARLAKRAGMRYVMFTTKHHDGFSMFDTKQTDFRITAPDCPYGKAAAQPDIARGVFDAFRKENFGIGAYFSKSDWHHPGYWDPDRPALDRNPNYDTAKEPQRWQTFVKFVHGQVEELMTGYGHIDILWLDGGQVRPPKQDIKMDNLAAMARKHQPHLLIVDRTAGTKHEQYRTPEQEVPDKPLAYPWESCLTMGNQWSFKPDDKYKSTRKLVHLLIDIVAKGGNLLLNVGPQPDGQLPAPAIQRLTEIGDWMEINAEAIHGTRPVEPYKEGSIAFTRKADTIYAILMSPEGENAPPATITLSSRAPKPRPGSQIHLLGHLAPLQWTTTPDGSVAIQIPESIQKKPPCAHAWAVRYAIEGGK